MITYEQLVKANELIAPMAIERTNKRTGEVIKKDYSEVNQRIKAFRFNRPNGSIITQMVEDTGERCVFTACVKDAEGNILGTGTAFEERNSSLINKTSYIENCETSAVGRALGMCGYGIETSVASKEEVENAMAQQDPKAQAPKVEYVDQNMISVLVAKCDSLNVNFEKLMANQKVKFAKDLTVVQFKKLMDKLNKEEAKRNGNKSGTD